MKINLYQVDAFSATPFSGNPAAVCPLDNWLDDTLMQNIAMENNLAETAFYVKNSNNFHIRWFTPKVEVDLCGHATLATAFIIFNFDNFTGDEIVFNSRSGILKVKKSNDLYTLNFPTDTVRPVEVFYELIVGFNIQPVEVYKGGTDYMLVFENEAQIRNLQPNFELISKVDCRGIIVTAKGDNVDFVSRFFAPQSGVSEDPVTGSAHTTLTPFWAARLNKQSLTAKQISERGGTLFCTHQNDRVEISGHACLVIVGELWIGE